MARVTHWGSISRNLHNSHHSITCVLIYQSNWLSWEFKLKVKVYTRPTLEKTTDIKWWSNGKWNCFIFSSCSLYLIALLNVISLSFCLWKNRSRPRVDVSYTIFRFKIKIRWMFIGGETHINICVTDHLHVHVWSPSLINWVSGDFPLARLVEYRICNLP